MKIKFTSNFMGAVFGEIHPRLFEAGKVYESEKTIDADMISIAISQGVADLVEEIPEQPKKNGWFKRGENKAMIPDDNKVMGTDIVSTLKPKPQKRARKKKE